MKIKTEQFAEQAVQQLGKPAQRSVLRMLAYGLPKKRAEVMASFSDPDAASRYSAAIRAEVIARLPELLERFEDRAAHNGMKVFWARDAAEANAYIVNLAKARGASYITKGKSMVTEELGTNEALERSGIEAVESDLGEFIAQQIGQPPFHIVGPAINVPVTEVSDLFMDKIGMKDPSDKPTELGYAARLYLRDKFHNLKMSITGVNMAVAETGTIINVENEGNIRLNKAVPLTQVSVMTLEKVVPTLGDALHLLRMLCRNCTGQKISSYVSLCSGPKRPEERDGPEELHLVIVDNGRSRIYQDLKAREAFRCIRCGACLAGCPVYTTIGGFPYGFAYSGPMGQVLNPLLLGLDRTQDLYRACTLCGRCKSLCPGGVDHPSLFLYYRAKDVEGDPEMGSRSRGMLDAGIYSVLSFGMKHSWAWALGTRAARRFLNRNSAEGVVSSAPGVAQGWFACRDLPAQKHSFHERWQEIGAEAGAEKSAAKNPGEGNGN